MNLKIKFLTLLFFLFLYSFVHCQPIRFAIIGDYGKTGANELAVSNLVDSWNVSFIITTGDNNYEYGGPYTIDSNIGFYYHEYIYPYIGIHGQGDTVNRFWPALGNHDWDSLNAQPYLNYFALPNNERYYDFVKGFIHFIAVDSDPREPNGITSSSVQALWVQNKLAQSTSRFKIVYFHHPPYSSGQHGSTPALQWPFRQWGASCVITGHDHDYERLRINNFTYFVNGLGGKSIYNFDTVIVAGSQFRYNANYGAQLATAWPDSINFKFYNINGTLIDSYTIFYTPTIIAKINNTVPGNFKLYQNYPNPFNPSAKIRFDITSNSSSGGEENVILKIYDILGREITTLVNEFLKPGSYQAEWNPVNLPSGTYYYKLTTGEFSETKKMILAK